MEIETEVVVEVGDRQVLIVPLWNWNLNSAAFVRMRQRFNRTFMELKYDDTVLLCIKGEF